MRHRSKREEEVLGSRISVSVVSDECQKQLAHNAIQQCFLESYRIQRSFSRFIPDSELSNLNKNVGEWTRVSDELFLLIRFSKEIQEMTGGAYDPTVCSILEGWGYDPEYSLNEKHPGHTGAIEFGKEQFVRITAPHRPRRYWQRICLRPDEKYSSRFSRCLSRCWGGISLEEEETKTISLGKQFSNTRPTPDLLLEKQE
jgi:hypothetical protein